MVNRITQTESLTSAFIINMWQQITCNGSIRLYYVGAAVDKSKDIPIRCKAEFRATV
jgi:hypothetical protein